MARSTEAKTMTLRRLLPQRGVLALQRSQPCLLVAGKPVLLATIDAVLSDPIAKGGVVDP